jgi:hypothetical protein
VNCLPVQSTFLPSISMLKIGSQKKDMNALEGCDTCPSIVYKHGADKTSNTLRDCNYQGISAFGLKAALG